MPSILVIGLGNPGKQYQHTRHNIGWDVIDPFVQQWEQKSRWKADVAVRGEVVFCKPQTYMNSSGEAAVAVAQFYNIPPQRMVVIYDDKDLPLGLLRVRSQGSSGGHNGVQSIINQLGTDEFGRIRIGIAPHHQVQNTARFVLGKWNKAEQLMVHQIVKEAAMLVEHCIMYLQTDPTQRVDIQLHQDRQVGTDELS